MLKQELFEQIVVILFAILVSLRANEDETENKPLDIKAVDKNICAVLKKPKPDPQEERDLMENLKNYYQYLDNISDRIGRGWREKENVNKLLNAIGKEGPQMIHCAVNAEDFKKAYYWDDDGVDTMTTTILGIRYMWDQVTRKTKFLNDEKS